MARSVASDGQLVVPARHAVIPPLERMLAVMRDARLSQRELAEWVMGRDTRTVQRYLSGGPIPCSQRQWLRRLRWVGVDGELVRIHVQRGAITRRWTTGQAA